MPLGISVRAALALLAIAVTGGLLAACGGASRTSRPVDPQTKARYEKQLRAAVRRYGRDIHPYPQSISVRDLARLARLMAGFEYAYRRLADALDAIRPPSNIESDHRELADDFREQATIAARARSSALRGDAERARAAARNVGFGSVIDDARQTMARIVAKGYSPDAFSPD